MMPSYIDNILFWIYYSITLGRFVIPDLFLDTYEAIHILFFFFFGFDNLSLLRNLSTLIILLLFKLVSS